MWAALVNFGKAIVGQGMQWLNTKLQKWTKPRDGSAVVETVNDLLRPKPELVLENALLRQQVIILQRGVKRPKVTNTDRRLLVLLASRLRTWRQALVVVKPETLLAWHRELFKLVWRQKSAVKMGRPPLTAEVVALIKRMAQENPLWGSERIRGELLKLNLHVAKRTIQKYIHQVRSPRPSTQNWRTFLHNHAQDVWACDFLPVVSLFFRQYFVFFIVELASRRVVHFGVTTNPTDAWAAQQLREATPFGEGPKYLIRDNDSKYGVAFARVAAGAGIKVLKTPIAAPNANAVCERFQKSVRRECLDHLFVLSQGHLYRMIQAYVSYFNWERPHQGIGQRIPTPSALACPASEVAQPITAYPVLGGLHHVYRRAA
ncbi:MAG: integrase core domain-containing protein [Chloroflexota bacterium]